MPKAVAVAEIAKRARGGALHQVTTIGSLEADGERRPKTPSLTSEDAKKDARGARGDESVPRASRRVTVIGIALSRDAGALDAGAPGYQVRRVSANARETVVGETDRDPETFLSGARSDGSRASRRGREAGNQNSGGEAAADDAEGAEATKRADAPRRRRARRGRRGRRGGATKKADAATGTTE